MAHLICKHDNTPRFNYNQSAVKARRMYVHEVYIYIYWAHEDGRVHPEEARTIAPKHGRHSMHTYFR